MVEANHYTVLLGVIKDVRMSSERVYEIVAGPNDAPLRSKLNIPLKSSAIWTRIPGENEGTPGAIYLGNWNSAGVHGSQGMVECVLVDDSLGIWYVSYGVLKDVTNIQVNGVSDTDFTVLGIVGNGGGAHFFQGGRPYTVLQDTASPIRTITDRVTCDVRGPDERGDVTGQPRLVKPAAMLRIAIASFCFNDWPKGASHPASGQPAFFAVGGDDPNTPMDALSNEDADDDFFAAHNVTAAMMLTSDDTGLGVIKTWAETFRCPVGWDTPFEIVTKPILLNRRSPYPTEKISKFLREVRKVKESTRGSDVTTALRTTYMFNSADAQFVKQSVEGNRFVEEQVEKPFEFTYGPAEIT